MQCKDLLKTATERLYCILLCVHPSLHSLYKNYGDYKASEVEKNKVIVSDKFQLQMIRAKLLF